MAEASVGGELAARLTRLVPEERVRKQGRFPRLDLGKWVNGKTIHGGGRD